MRHKLFLFVLVLSFLFTNVAVVYSAGNVENHIDAVLVVDLSGSMRGNDPNRIAIEGVKLFIDMMEYNGSRVAVLGFESRLRDISGGFKEINTTQDKTELLAKIDAIGDYEGATDIGMALKEAESLLFRQRSQDKKPIVILFTDGYVEVSANSSRTNAQSLAEIEETLLGASGNYPIYTIGLNSTSRVDEDLLENIAGTTDARSYMTSDPKDLPEIFNDIFARHIKSNVLSLGTLTTDGQNYSSVDIDIPNSSVVEANIVLLTGNPIIDAKLTNPSGTDLALIDSNNIYFSKSNYYSLIKIIEPAQGKWTLSVKGVRGDQIKVNLLYSYSMEFEASFANSNVKKGDTVTVLGKLMNQGVDLQDPDLLAEFNAQMEVYDSGGNVIASADMENKGMHMESDYVLPSAEGEYTFIIKAAGVGFYRESNPISITIENQPVELVETIPDKTLFSFPMINDSVKLELSEYFSDSDDSQLKYEVTNDSDKLEYEIIDDSLLVIKATNALQFGSANFSVIVSDPSATNAESVFAVRVIPILLFVLMAVGFVILVILLVVARKLLKEKNRILKGRVRCVCVKGGIDMGPPLPKELALFKGRVGVDKCVGPLELAEFPALDKITFIQAEGQYALDFTNNSQYTIKNLTKLDKNFRLEQGGTIKIINSDNAELKFTYTN